MGSEEGGVVQALFDRKADEAGGSATFAADLANAIAAVDLTDVMQEDKPFRTVEQQGLRDTSIDLTSQRQQQEEGNALGSGAESGTRLPHSG